MEGFSGKIHDDPMVRVLLLSCGEQAAIVSMDMVMLLPPGVKCVKQAVEKMTGTKPENIWVHTTHAITTPHMPHPPFGGKGKELTEEQKQKLDADEEIYLAALNVAAEQAAKAAKGSFRPAKMGVGKGESFVNVNRDISTPFGWWTGFNPNGYSNHTAAVLRFDDEDGGMIGALVSFALKASAIDNSEMKQGTRQVCADIPGLACALLEERFGAPCLFAMSAACDQVPREMALYDVVQADGSVKTVDLGVEKGLEIVDRLGREMADDFARIIEAAQCTVAHAPITLNAGSFEWTAKGRAKMQPTLPGQGEYRPDGPSTVEALTLAIGDVAFAGLKAELNAVTEAQLRQASPYGETLVMTMVNGSHKYVPDQASYDNCSFAALGAPVMPGAAERWVEECVRLMTEMKG